EAAAGYGKSVLAAELSDVWNLVGVDVQLDRGGVSAPLLVARLRAAVLRAGYTEAAAAAREAGEDLVGSVDAILDALAGENCLLVIDDAHEAGEDAAVLIDRIANELRGGERLLVLGRRLPKGAERLRRAEHLHLTTADLALTSEETLRLCRTGFGLDLDAARAEALESASGGWTAATVLAAARAARTGETGPAMTGPVGSSHGPDHAVAAILDEAVSCLPADDCAGLAQVARLPLVDADVVVATTRIEGLFERAITAGIPFTPSQGAWYEMPGPVREHLARLASPDPEALRRAADDYRRRNRPSEALRLLLAAGQPLEAAEVLATMPPEIAESLDVLEMHAVVDQLPAEALEAHPQVLVVLARSLRVATLYEQDFEMLSRALAISARTGDRVSERAANAGLANHLFIRLDSGAAARLARQVLAEAAPEEQLTRAWANNALAMSLCAATDATGRRDAACLAQAEECFARAEECFLTLGLRSAASSLAPYRAISLELAKGRAATALKRLDDALSLVVDRPRRWGYVMCFKIVAAAELGEDDLCRASADEVFRVAEQLDSDLFRANGHWRLAILTSYRGLAEETLDHLRKAESYKGGWWLPGSGDFLAEAADYLDRVGYTALAWQYLARVKAEPKDAGYKIALAEAAIEARHGDPVAAEERIAEAANSRIDLREYWRLSLFRAFAALRRGDERTAGALAATAFEEAARLGQEGLPLLRERQLTEQLLGLAAETGQPAALALQAHTAPVALSLLGRFELSRAGRPVPVRSGLEAQLLKIVAVRGGRLHAEQAIESFWPEVDPDTGRNRLRTVLNRLRAATGSVLDREGEMLVLDPALRVDYAELLADEERIASLAGNDTALAAALARGAIARYRGDLLPDDPYEEWAEGPRRRAQAAVLGLLQLCADEAAARDDLDGLRRLIARSIELAPYDAVLYARAASALLSQGRRGEALSIVSRARSAYAGLGLEPPGELLDVEAAVAS
ncbi:MAG TPA: BTAD domain-containing putative transcriptional regulator, partial [Acidimicrobiales bacterium]|nr:BTAD domain-containing putative transcriptional regulator [Acidimicrobiales bacterium]